MVAPFSNDSLPCWHRAGKGLEPGQGGTGMMQSHKRNTIAAWVAAALCASLLSACQSSSTSSSSPSTPPASTPSSGSPSGGSPSASAPASTPGNQGEQDAPSTSEAEASTASQETSGSTSDSAASTSPGTSTEQTTRTADGDATEDEAVLDRAMDVLRRSSEKDRQAQTSEAEGQATSPETGTSKAEREAMEDLAERDLEDLLEGDGSADSDSAEGSPGDTAASSEQDSETATTSDGRQGSETDGGWHQPGASGSAEAPDSDQVYGGGRQGTADTASGSNDGDAPTGAERTEVLERVLAESMGDFDGRILEERQNARTQDTADEDSRGGEDPRAATTSSGSDVSGEGRDRSGRRPAPGMPGGTDSGNDEVPQGPVAGPATDSQRDGDYPVPEDIGDGDNDDVVARQLREAAMNEPDPELREKLWDEYRRYVSGRN